MTLHNELSLVVGRNLLLNLHEQSSLGVVAQIELLTEFFDNFVGLVSLIDADLFNVLAVKLDLEHADRLFVGNVSARLRLFIEVLTHLRLVVGSHFGALVLMRSFLRLELSRALVHRSRLSLLRARPVDRLLLTIPRIILSLLRCSGYGLHLRL